MDQDRLGIKGQKREKKDIHKYKINPYPNEAKSNKKNAVVIRNI